MELVRVDNQLTEQNRRYFNPDEVVKRFKKLGFDRFTSSVATRYINYCSMNAKNLQRAKAEFIASELSHIGRINNYSSALNKTIAFCSDNGMKWVLNTDVFNVNFDTMLNEFLNEFSNSRTFSSYKNALIQYQKFIQGKLNKALEVKEQLKQLFSNKNVKQFKVHLQNEGRSARTVNQYLAACKSFARFAKINFEEIEDASGMTEKEANRIRVRLDNIRTIKGAKIDKDTASRGSFNEEELQKLIEGAETTQDKLLLSLSAYLGLRPSEARELTREALSANGYTIKGKGKDTKKFIPFMPSKVWELVKDMPGGALFPGVTYQKQLSMFKDTVKRAGFQLVDEQGLKISPHSLRHSFVQLLVVKGVDIKTVKELARHSSFDTTEIYFRKLDNKESFSEVASLF